MANYNNYTMEELLKKSIQVKKDMLANYSDVSYIHTVNVSDIIPKFPNRFSINSSTIAFIWEEKFFVTPITDKAINTLLENGFIEDFFYVPFSNGDYPLEERERWEGLFQRARNIQKEEFAHECNTYCDENNIGVINDEILNNCFIIPQEGVPVKHSQFEDHYYPTIRNFVFDRVAKTKIGTYSVNKDRVVFVYRDGQTYVTKGHKIISELKANGYKEGKLFVPFAHNEIILNKEMESKWNSIV